MSEKEKTKAFTLYFEGLDAHHGNVILNSFLNKIKDMQVLFSKMERAYNNSRERETVFEIVNVEKKNPTTISLNPVAEIEGYDPKPAFEWGMEQINAVSKNKPTDPKIDIEIVKTLIKIATKDNNAGYKKFWINGYSDTVQFDEFFLENAKKVNTIKNKALLINRTWYKGTSFGSVAGILGSINAFDKKNEFFIKQPYKEKKIKCKFPDEMHDEMPNYLFHNVKVAGKLHYNEESPFPYLVEANKIENIDINIDKKPFIEMRGMFGNYEQPKMEWDELLDE